MDIVDTKEIATLLGYATISVASRLCASGKLTSARKVGDSWIADRSEVLAYKVTLALAGKKRGPKTSRHGRSGTYLYWTWQNMKKTKPFYVCPEWDDFLLFEAWAYKNGYRLGMKLVRIDKEKGFDSSNCALAEPGSQEKATPPPRLSGDGRKVIVKETVEKVISLAEACRRHGVAYKAVQARLKRGWPLWRALNEPLRKNGTGYTSVIRYGDKWRADYRVDGHHKRGPARDTPEEAYLDYLHAVGKKID